MMLIVALVICWVAIVEGSTVLVDQATRNGYLSQAPVWFPEQEALISTRDMFHGPPNPYNFQTWQSIECDFVEPDPADPIGGTTPKFQCDYNFNGETVRLKIKYDQQYNPVNNWGHGNEEVYAGVISQRILWALGFGTDIAIPVQVTCRNCPIEPWTYVQVKQGYVSEDVASGWMDMSLVKSGKWDQKVDSLYLSSAAVYLKFNNFYDGDEIDYLDANNQTQSGFGWPELYSLPIADETQTTTRDALTLIAAFISHVDNFDGNQALICLDTDSKSKSVKKTKDSCKGQPFAYIHDVGGTLGYGWKLSHLNFWPNYMDLTQWSELSVWKDLNACEVQVNGIPGCSWMGGRTISEAGRAMGARLLSQLTAAQINDLFVAARANLMRNDKLEDWIAGFQAKLQRDVLGVQCGAGK